MRSHPEFRPRNNALVAMYKHLPDAPGTPISRHVPPQLIEAPKPPMIERVTFPNPDREQAVLLATTAARTSSDLTSVLEVVGDLYLQQTHENGKPPETIIVPAQELISQHDNITPATVVFLRKMHPTVIVVSEDDNQTDGHVVFQTPNVLVNTFNRNRTIEKPPESSRDEIFVKRGGKFEFITMPKILEPASIAADGE